MNLRPLGNNQTELEVNGGLTLFFSYRTPVACKWINGNGVRIFYRTDKRWSNTTSKHITKWFNLQEAHGFIEVKSQEYFDRLLSDNQYEEVNHA